MSEIDQALAQLGAAGLSTTAALSLATTSFGVPFGAQNPVSDRDLKSGQSGQSGLGSTSGACGRRSFAKAA